MVHEFFNGFHHLLVIDEEAFDLIFFVNQLRFQFEILIDDFSNFFDGQRRDAALNLLCIKVLNWVDEGNAFERVASWRGVH
jgi:hypothetical protein